MPVKERKMQKKMLRQIISGVILLLVVASAVFAAAPPEDVLVTNSWMIDDPIVGALRDISSQTGVRIVPDETVVGYFTTDLTLENVPLKEALRRILAPGGYTFRWMDTFYLVGAPVPDNPNFSRLTETEIINLNYVSANSIVGEFLNILPKNCPHSSLAYSLVSIKPVASILPAVIVKGIFSG